MNRGTYSYGSDSPFSLRDTVRGWWHMRRYRPPNLDRLTFPVYVLADGDSVYHGHGESARDGVDSVSLRQGETVVTTELPGGRAPGRAAAALLSVLINVDVPELSSRWDAELERALGAHRDRVAARVKRAEPFTVELPVDGVPVRFSGLRDPGGWAAAAELAEVWVIVSARGAVPAGVALRRR